MSDTFNCYIRERILEWRREGKVPGMTAREYRAHRRTMRRMWQKLPREMRR